MTDEPDKPPSYFATPANPIGGVSELSPSDLETLETLREIEALFRKEAACEWENIDCGGSSIALGRWRRYFTTLANVTHDLPELITHGRELLAARAQRSADVDALNLKDERIMKLSRELEVAKEAADKDAFRLDWLEYMGNRKGGLLLHSENETGRLGLGLTNTGRSLRRAIDDAACDDTMKVSP